jgi:hypothetical protein
MCVMFRLPKRAGEERGATLVITILWLSVCLLLLVFVVEAGNWYVHKRHLQMQADAGVLAAAQDFSYPCTNSSITSSARQYSGSSGASSQHNKQVSPNNQGAVSSVINSTNYPHQGGSDYSAGTPCTTSFIDVKLVEANAPLFFSGLLPGVAPNIRSHARATVFAQYEQGDNLPLAVSDVVPNTARVEFVNLSSGSVVASAPMSATGTANGYNMWTSAAASVTVTSQMGIRVILSGGTTTACADDLVECYDDVLFIRGYDTSTVIRSVYLTAGSCAYPYFFASSSGSCSQGIAADLAGVNPSIATATATVGGTVYTLTHNGSVFAGSFPVAAAAGLVTATISWAQTSGSVNGSTCTSAGNNPCKGTVTTAQRVHSGSEATSGVIRVAEVVDASTGQTYANSLTLGSHLLQVRIGLQSVIAAASTINDPATTIRIRGSRNNSINCDPNLSNTRDEIEQGCGPEYRINTNPTVDCQTTPNTTEPWPCVALKPGISVGQINQGFDTRILKGQGCAAHPNNWSQFPRFPLGDTRLLNVFVLPFGSLASSTSRKLPVVKFASLYVTGWGGSNCAGNDSAPSGAVVGHFIKYITTLNEYGGPLTQTCDLSSLGNCVVVMTD